MRLRTVKGDGSGSHAVVVLVECSETTGREYPDFQEPAEYGRCEVNARDDNSSDGRLEVPVPGRHKLQSRPPARLPALISEPWHY